MLDSTVRRTSSEAKVDCGLFPIFSRCCVQAARCYFCLKSRHVCQLLRKSVVMPVSSRAGIARVYWSEGRKKSRLLLASTTLTTTVLALQYGSEPLSGTRL